MSPTLTDSDGQVHRRLRLLVSKAFTPKRVAELEGRIRENVDALIDEFADDGRADIIERFAWNLPMFTLTDMLGIPRADIPTLHRWSVSWLRILQATDSVEELVICARDVVTMQRYFMDEFQGRVGEDLMSSLLDARVAGDEPIRHEEAARLQLKIALPRLFERLPNLRMAAGADTAVRDTIFFARGFKRLEIEWDVQAPSAG
ncbi:hypothetical protein [Acrocarpospora sp. B8E8]|uniref:hypothetical protein n=1 Tax=Acrocarpospora sp. B8E8 TaxID=3153572 RepID=UPI00325E45AA